MFTHIDEKKEIRARTKATMIFLANGLCEENIYDIFDYVGTTLTEDMENPPISYLKIDLVKKLYYRKESSVFMFCHTCNSFYLTDNKKTRLSIEARHTKSKKHLNKLNKKYHQPYFNEKQFKKVYSLRNREYAGTFNIMKDKNDIYGIVSK